MKTKELVRLLQQWDPSGELEVCCNNEDIWIVSRQPAYYDGALQLLVRDETRSDYNIVGAKVVKSGEKIRLETMGIRDAIWDNAELPVDTGGDASWAKSVEEIRAEVRACDEEIRQQESKKNDPSGER